MPSRTDFHKVIIGRAEEMHFPEYHIHNVPAKIDTGAYRSAIHASNIRLNKKTGVLTFRLLGGHPVCGPLAQVVETNFFKVVSVANSFGHSEERYEVKLKTKIGPKVFIARFTLADRSKKIYPILLGRTLLSRRFLIDTDQTSLDRVELKQKYGIEFPNDEEEGRE
ncbi:MAG TPA: RimK/LysX family protein [Candidatus Saccharimonadales bacterium]